jgi:hypothetical protein|tara:strand:+ start:1030 stop:1776 length:747 start_codon:yes stop_codon:yes gene_type:complete
MGDADFHVGLARARIAGIPQPSRCLFHLDGFKPFTKAPLAHAHAMLEWGMNWCISEYASDRLILHAATVARKGVATLISGNSGSGKSTLACALMLEGYRLLTDELSLINLNSSTVTPFVRPVSLKEKSIEVIKNRYANSEFGVSAFATHKGTVSHCKPSEKSWQTKLDDVHIKHIIFPKYNASCKELSVTEIASLDVFNLLNAQSFNINILGVEAIRVLQNLSESCVAYGIEYNDLSSAVDFIDGLYE